MADVAQRLANLSPAQRKLLDARLKKNPNVSQPIAIVGHSCRLPGSPNPNAYWDLVTDRRIATREIPKERWDVDQYYDSDPDTPGKTSARHLAMVDNVREFDAMFFGITPREAAKMDPQQRLLLEVTWEAFEHAGMAADQLSGTATGVFVGIGGSDYAKIPNAYDNYLDYIDAYIGTGNALSIAANRLSYLMDLRGPSIAVDTACSSGLVALHLAIQSLRSGDCDQAVAGAVNLVLSPEVIMAFSKARMLSLTGECRPFDAAANGYVRGEGCGMLVLKRLTDATRDGDDVLGVIRGSAVNQDGRTSGITAPNSLSQQDCIRAAWTSAGIDGSQVSYIEAHGTGTPLGDPIEFQSLTKLFPQREGDNPVYVTSSKANIGHTETVSGIAGLIKVLLMMKHGQIPGQTAFEELNPNIQLAGSRLVIPREMTPWTSNDPLIAGVSSFGFGGTNAHIIVESSGAKPAPPPQETPTPERPQQLLTISAKSAKSLVAISERLLDRIATIDDSDVADLCYSANVGRSHFNHRSTITANNKESLQAGLSAIIAGKRLPSVKSGEVRIATRPKIAFLFTGQGSQYPQMGKRLYQSHPVYRDALDTCSEILRDHLERPLLDVIFPADDDKTLHQTAYTQPSLFAVEYALARLWRSWGIEPSILLGHSVGEYVAACLAGVFSLEDGLRLLAKRAELMQRLPQNGTMAVIFAPRQDVEHTLKDFDGRVVVATANGPENNVIAGETAIVDDVVAQFEKLGIGTQRLNVSHAFHSPLMDPMLDEFESFAAGMEFNRPTIPIVSNRTGTIIDSAEFDATYWRDHIRNCVEFKKSMVTLGEENVHAMLEIGPTASLLGMGRRCLPDSQCAWVPSLRRARNDWESLIGAVAELYVMGVKIDWRGFDQPWFRRRMELPNYPFDRVSHWIMDTETPVSSGGGRGPSLHPLIGSHFRTAFDSELYESRFSAENPRHLKEHQLQGSMVVPASAYIEQGMAIANLRFSDGKHAVENIAIQQAMFLPVEGHRIVQLTVSPELGGRSSFETYSISSESLEQSPKWQLHVTGTIVHEDGAQTATAEHVDMQSVRSRQQQEVLRDEFYDVMEARSLVYGPSFRILGNVFRTETEALAAIEMSDSVQASLSQYHLHPCLGDAMMQCVAGTVPLEPDGGFSPHGYVPVRVRRARILAPLTDTLYAYAHRISTDSRPSPETVESNVFLLDSEGNVLVEFAGVTIHRVGRSSDESADENPHDWLYDIRWESKPLDPAPEDAFRGHYLLLTDDDHAADFFAERFGAAGGQVTVVKPGPEFEKKDDHYVVRPLERDDYVNLFSELAAQDVTLAGVVHMWSAHCEDPTTESRDEAFVKAHDRGVGSALRLIQAAARLTSGSPQLWFVTCGATTAGNRDVVACQAPLWGMGKVAVVEHPELAVRMVDLDIQGTAASNADSLIQELAGNSPEDHIAYRDSERLVSRLAVTERSNVGDTGADQMPVPSDQPFRLRIKGTGSFDALHYEASEREAAQGNEVEIQVHATGLNFSDVLKALGLYPGITDDIVPMGIEAAGIVTSVGDEVDRFSVGDEVMGVVPYSFASHAKTAEYALVKKPKNIAFDEACTIPVTFLTAYYGLTRLAQLQPGERVLIHAGAGGVGLAAIQIAQKIGAEIFATAGSDEKRDFLRSLGVQHVMNSRTLDFADEIREITNRQGVDVVLNSLPGDAINASLQVLRAYGRFLEIGKTDIYSNSMIGLLPFQDNLSYFAIDLDRMLRQRPDYIRPLFAELMVHFENGEYEPLPFTHFTSGSTIDAFRYMAQRKNIGKVVVGTDIPDLSDEARGPAKFAAKQDATYLITGGLGGLGLQVAQWLVSQGAGHVALMSRGTPDEQKQSQVSEIANSGALVSTIQGDVADLDSLKAALQQIPDDWPKIAGIIHAAGVLQDGVMFDMTMEQLDKPLTPKIRGTWNLHDATKGESLDFFVLFSSIACVLGSPGQSNYAAANAYLDAFANWRRSQGLVATSINWGPWSSAGMATEEIRVAQLASRGMRLLPSDAALDLLGELIISRAANTVVMSARFEDMIRTTRGKTPPLLEHVTAGMSLGSSTDSGEDRAYQAKLASLQPDQRNELLCQYFANELGIIMGMEAEDIDVIQPLGTMGLDSLMAIELKNKIENKLEMTLPIAVFMNDPSVSTLATYVAENFGQTANPPSDSDSIELAPPTA